MRCRSSGGRFWRLPAASLSSMLRTAAEPMRSPRSRAPPRGGPRPPPRARLPPLHGLPPSAAAPRCSAPTYAQIPLRLSPSSLFFDSSQSLCVQDLATVCFNGLVQLTVSVFCDSSQSVCIQDYLGFNVLLHLTVSVTLVLFNSPQKRVAHHLYAAGLVSCSFVSGGNLFS